MSIRENGGPHVGIKGQCWQRCTHKHTCLLQSSVRLLCGVTGAGEGSAFLMVWYKLGEINLKNKNNTNHFILPIQYEVDKKDICFLFVFSFVEKKANICTRCSCGLVLSQMQLYRFFSCHMSAFVWLLVSVRFPAFGELSAAWCGFCQKQTHSGVPSIACGWNAPQRCWWKHKDFVESQRSTPAAAITWSKWEQWNCGLELQC